MEILKDFSAVIASLVLGVVGFLLSIYHHKNSVKLAKQQHKNAFELQKHEFEKGLFENFNKKYDELNEVLNDLAKNGHLLENYEISFIKEKYIIQYKTIMDFFNLCAEEYYWHKKGRIGKDVWEAWFVGMNFYYKNSLIIRRLWEEEIKDDGYVSFYLKKGDNLFKEYEKK